MNSDGHLLYLQNTGYCAMGRSLMIYHETIRKVSQSNAIMKGTLLKFFFFCIQKPTHHYNMDMQFKRSHFILW